MKYFSQRKTNVFCIFDLCEEHRGLKSSRCLPHVCTSSFQTLAGAFSVVFFFPFLALSGAAVGKRPPRDRLRAGQQWEVKAVSLNLISMLLISSHLWSNLPCREVKLSVVSYLTNSIVDQILQELYATHKTLVRAQHTWNRRFFSFWLPTEVNWRGHCAVSDSAGVPSEALGGDGRGRDELEVQQAQRLSGHHGRGAEQQHRE